MDNSYHNDDFDDDHVYNHHSGDAENVVQARDVYGGVNYYEANEGTFEYEIPPYAQTAVFVALFIVSSTYSTLFSATSLSLFDWLKLLASTTALFVAFVSAYYWAAGGLLERNFRYLRLFLALLFVVLGYNYGAQIPLIGELSEPISGWLIWQF